MTETKRDFREKAWGLIGSAIVFAGALAVDGYFLGRSQGQTQGRTACEKSIGENTQPLASYNLTQTQVAQLTEYGNDEFYTVNPSLGTIFDMDGMAPIFQALNNANGPRVVQVEVPFEGNVAPTINTAVIEQATAISSLITIGTHDLSIEVLAPEGVPANTSYPDAPMIVEIDRPVCS